MKRLVQKIEHKQDYYCQQNISLLCHTVCIVYGEHLTF